MKHKLKKNKGITLIALVVTIIVLLILAGISISMLTGENGILNRAVEAKKNTMISNIEEKNRLIQAEAMMNQISTEYNGVKIPQGCAPTKADGESSIEDGLTIIDENGNEWVWIEVPKTSEVYKQAGLEIKDFNESECEKIYNDLKDYTDGYSGYSDTYSSSCGLDEKEYNSLKKEMVKSIYENAGFWIGRYETGVENAILENNENLQKAVIQKDKYSYNFVTCSQAQKLSNELKVNNKNSSLMFGIQWKLTLKFIERYGKKSDGTSITQNEILNDTSSWGNNRKSSFTVETGAYATFNGSWKKVEKNLVKNNNDTILTTTGSVEKNKILNIYDLAGNVWEFTLENTTVSNKPAYRGGSFCNDRFVSQYTYGSEYAMDIGFRTTMY